ncbi:MULTISPECIES: 2-hydroxyacid dehydrogenase [unclassified Leisingera]|uniref:2-hydroxyacid dehydrogenase n=1 Tax=unclassified Leisingera TaxID=2614906 RepID=UPI000316C532|nr:MULTISPECIES: glyoxylate/hydroxypyruvate reductase A [unclassified Leisingera]KIC22272.1 hydroxyacid dehydrogenase [Leisingera sp. ANG-S3]KIC53543.1 hydroxyacid dehydrogenase [Leisingera sp. ANG-S]
MTANILFAGHPDAWPAYEPLLKAELARLGVDSDLRNEFAPEEVDYIVYAPSGPVSDFTPFTRLKAVLSLWAGVEKIVPVVPAELPLTRMVDSGLEQGMTEWVVGHTLRYHLGMDAHILGQNGHWEPKAPPLAKDRSVTVLGLGALGTASAKALAVLGFQVSGWSRSQKDIAGITCHSGAEGLKAALAQAEIVILLLPDTPATENTLNAETLALLPKGARILNPGRGPLIDDDALLAALDSGQVGHATLDVFRVEPLPPEHPYWAHPNVTVTPHIASETRESTAAEVIAENIRRTEAGEPLLHLVDRSLGY